MVVGQLIEQLHLTTEIRGSNPVIDILFTIDFNIKTKIKEKEAGNGQKKLKSPEWILIINYQLYRKDENKGKRGQEWQIFFKKKPRMNFNYEPKLPPGSSFKFAKMISFELLSFIFSFLASHDPGKQPNFGHINSSNAIKSNL